MAGRNRNFSGLTLRNQKTKWITYFDGRDRRMMRPQNTWSESPGTVTRTKNTHTTVHRFHFDNQFVTLIAEKTKKPRDLLHMTTPTHSMSRRARPKRVYDHVPRSRLINQHSGLLAYQILYHTFKDFESSASSWEKKIGNIFRALFVQVWWQHHFEKEKM